MTDAIKTLEDELKRRGYQMSEAELKLAVEELLQIEMNRGNLVFLRLNAGDFIEVRGNTRRRIKGCPKGTADLMVIQKEKHCYCPGPCWDESKVIFLELKSAKGRWSPGQRAFKILVEEQGCEYFVVRSVDEVMKILDIKE